MANYYTGVPVGGTIMWAGSLVGLPVPDNFTENYQLGSYSNPRKEGYISATSLPSSANYLLIGGVSNPMASPSNRSGTNSFNLSYSHMPKFTFNKRGSDFPSFNWTSSQVSGLVTIDDTTSSRSVNTGNSSQGNRYHAGGTGGIGTDNSSSFGGSGRIFYWTSGSPSHAYTSSSHSHSYSEVHHTHSIDLPLTVYTYGATTNRLNTSSQSPISYDVVSASRGIQLITRMY